MLGPGSFAMQPLSAPPIARPVDPMIVTAPRAEGKGVAMARPVAPPTSAPPNPTLRLDASLGLVVLEFRNLGGEPRTIPSERELDAYRVAARGGANPGTEGPPARSGVGAATAGGADP
jgi:hypothetical protein